MSKLPEIFLDLEDHKLEKILNSVDMCNISPYQTFEILKSYKVLSYCVSDKEYEKLKSILNKEDKYRNKLKEGENVLIISTKTKNICITKSKKHSFLNVLKILDSEKILSDKQLSQIKDFCSNNLCNMENGICLNLDDIRTIFPCISVFSNGFIIYENIFPDKYIYKNKVYEIPKNNRKYHSILSCTIYLNDKFKIVATKIDNTNHPNCSDEGWFCLGEMENKRVDKKSIMELMSCIKIFNLDNCYKYPYWFEQKFK